MSTKNEADALSRGQRGKRQSETSTVTKKQRIRGKSKKICSAEGCIRSTRSSVLQTDLRKCQKKCSTEGSTNYATRWSYKKLGKDKQRYARLITDVQNLWFKSCPWFKWGAYVGSIEVKPKHCKKLSTKMCIEHVGRR